MRVKGCYLRRGDLILGAYLSADILILFEESQWFNSKTECEVGNGPRLFVKMIPSDKESGFNVTYLSHGVFIVTTWFISDYADYEILRRANFGESTGT